MSLPPPPGAVSVAGLWPVVRQEGSFRSLAHKEGSLQIEGSGGDVPCTRNPMAVGQNLWLHFGVDEHLFATYFDVHQGYRVLTTAISQKEVPRHGFVFFEVPCQSVNHSGARQRRRWDRRLC